MLLDLCVRIGRDSPIVRAVRGRSYIPPFQVVCIMNCSLGMRTLMELCIYYPESCVLPVCHSVGASFWFSLDTQLGITYCQSCSKMKLTGLFQTDLSQNKPDLMTAADPSLSLGRDRRTFSTSLVPIWRNSTSNRHWKHF